ncbi:MAG TPA: glycosyltransferase family 39 protein, partial [bacterium]|nr:glycosyltransferase family 39 protein [bacterium]
MTRGRLVPLVGTALVALTVRWLYFRDLLRQPALLVPQLDAAAHLEWARGALDGTWPPATPFFRAPGYVWALATLIRVAGDDPVRLAAAQLALGTATPVLVALLAERLHGNRGALVAGIGAALYPVFPFFEGQLLIPALSIPLLLVALVASLALFDRPAPLRAFGIGVLWGAVGVVRPPLLLLATLVPAFLAAGRARRAAVLVAAGMVILPGLVTARNARTGDLVVIASHAGLNLY